MTIKTINRLAVWVGFAGLSAAIGAWAQLPDAPSATGQAQVPSKGAQSTSDYSYASYLVRAGAICGAGASSSTDGTKPTVNCGVGFSFFPPAPIFVELGVMGPFSDGTYPDGYVSVDGSIPLWNVKSKYLPMALLGYSRLFETGNALDYGLALAMPHKTNDYPTSLRLELRDYWLPANPSQHNVMLRLGWMIVTHD